MDMARRHFVAARGMVGRERDEMTVTTATARVVHNGNDTTVQFAVPFRFLENSHVAVFLRGAAGAQVAWAEGTQYSLSGAGVPAGGTLTVVTAPTDYTPAAGEKLVIIRNVPNTQESDYVENDPFPAETLEDDLDKRSMIDQQQVERLDRTFTIPEADLYAGSFELPIDTERAGRFLAFDLDGGPIVAAGTTASLGPVSAFGETLLDDADAATARATLGAASDAEVAKLAGDNTLIGDNTSAGDTLLNGPLALGPGSERTIAAGAITPTGNYHTVDTEADMATDDLTDIATTNIPDRGVLVLRAAVGTRTVIVRHTASGAGKIVLDNGTDYALDDSAKSITLQRRGDHWEELGRSAPRASVIETRSAQATTSGTEKEFLDIPSDAVRLDISFTEIGSTAAALHQIQLGTATSYETTGYVGAVWTIGSGVSWSGGILLERGAAAGGRYSGVVTIQRQELTSDDWAISGNSYAGDVNIASLSGYKTLAGALTRLKLITSAGTLTNGSVGLTITRGVSA
ncbi:MAG: hypothetical protein HKM95_08025 [Inquilinus sp.]|nr:hypothetical protein [Inquilinus sp.]